MHAREHAAGSEAASGFVAAQVTALTTALGVLRGTNNEAFAVALVFSLVVSPPHCAPSFHSLELVLLLRSARPVATLHTAL